MSKIGFMAMIADLMRMGYSERSAYQEASTLNTLGGGPIFAPKKHTKMSYAKQNRLAKGRKNKSMYSSN